MIPRMKEVTEEVLEKVLECVNETRFRVKVYEEVPEFVREIAVLV